MGSKHIIINHLRSFRRYWLLTDAIQGLAILVVACAVATLVLACLAQATGPASFWPAVTLGVNLFLTVAVIPIRGLWRARHVGNAKRTAIRAAGPFQAWPVTCCPPSKSRQISRGLACQRGFFDDVAGRLPKRVSSMVPLRRRAIELTSALIVGAVILLPASLSSTLERGFERLVSTPSLFDGARLSPVPLLENIHIDIRPPGYTGLPSRRIDGVSGDIAALVGSEIQISGRLTRNTTQAQLLFGATGDASVLPARLWNHRPVPLANPPQGRTAPDKARGQWLTARLVVESSKSFYLWIDQDWGRPFRESVPWKITALADRPPKVEIEAPADVLELEAPGRSNLATSFPTTLVLVQPT